MGYRSSWRAGRSSSKDESPFEPVPPQELRTVRGASNVKLPQREIREPEGAVFVPIQDEQDLFAGRKRSDAGDDIDPVAELSSWLADDDGARDV